MRATLSIGQVRPGDHPMLAVDQPSPNGGSWALGCLLVGSVPRQGHKTTPSLSRALHFVPRNASCPPQCQWGCVPSVHPLVHCLWHMRWWVVVCIAPSRLRCLYTKFIVEPYFTPVIDTKQCFLGSTEPESQSLPHLQRFSVQESLPVPDQQGSTVHAAPPAFAQCVPHAGPSAIHTASAH